MENTTQRLGSMSLGDKKRRTTHAFHELNSETFSPVPDPHFDPNMAASSIGLHAPTQQAFSPNLSTPSLGFPSTMDSAPLMNSMVMPQTELQSDTHKLYAKGVSESLAVATLRNESNKRNFDGQFLSFEHVSPPIAGTPYRAIDQYNATPKFARMSMYSLPYNDELKQSSKIPLGMELRPFADLVVEEERDEPVPEIDVTNVEFVPRCRRCRAYLNPGMKTSGHKMDCNICGFQSPLPSEYYSGLDNNGTREDFQSRPELFKGVIDYIVPKEYNWNEEETSHPMNRVFLIDTSFEAYKTKVTEAMCNAIRTTLYDDMGQSTLPRNAKIAIIGYDTTIQFYDLSSDLEQTSMYVVTDLDDPFLPISQGLFADPMESAQIIDTTLMTIEQQSREARSGIAFGAAIKAAGLALNEYGGQIIASISQLPMVAPGNLKLKILENGEQEWIKSICTPNDKYYQDLLNNFTMTNVSLNLFVASQNSVDLGNLGNIAIKSGGIVKEWLHFNIERDEVTFMFAIKEVFDSIAGYQCQLKVRCSHGLIVKKYYGCFETADDSGLAINIANVGANTSIVCEFGYNGTLDAKKDAHFQAALLYTSKDGVRKVRVINSIVSITQRLADVFAFSDQDTIVKLLIRESLSAFTTGTLTGLKRSLLMKISDINVSYRVNVSNPNSALDMLVLPNSLKTLPMMLLSIWKSKAYGSKVNVPDIRLSSFFNLMNYNSSKLSVYLYPILICLHSLDENDCIINESNGLFKIPKTIPTLLSNLEYGGAYLIFNGEKLMVWLHKDVNPMLLSDLFGENYNSIQQVPSFISQLPYLDTHISKQVRELCRFLSRHYNNYENMSVEVCRFGMDQNEVEFQQMFVEDRNNSLDPSYADLLKTLYEEIEKKVKNEGGSSGGKFHNGGGGNNSLQHDDGVSLTSRFGF